MEDHKIGELLHSTSYLKATFWAVKHLHHDVGGGLWPQSHPWVMAPHTSTLFSWSELLLLRAPKTWWAPVSGLQVQTATWTCILYIINTPTTIHTRSLPVQIQYQVPLTRTFKVEILFSRTVLPPKGFITTVDAGLDLQMKKHWENTYSTFSGPPPKICHEHTLYHPAAQVEGNMDLSSNLKHLTLTTFPCQLLSVGKTSC